MSRAAIKCLAEYLCESGFQVYFSFPFRILSLVNYPFSLKYKPFVLKAVLLPDRFEGLDIVEGTERERIKGVNYIILTSFFLFTVVKTRFSYAFPKEFPYRMNHVSMLFEIQLNQIN